MLNRAKTPEPTRSEDHSGPKEGRGLTAPGTRQNQAWPLSPQASTGWCQPAQPSEDTAQGWHSDSQRPSVSIHTQENTSGSCT